MDYLIDANICIYAMTGRYPIVRQRIAQATLGQIGLSSIVVSELKFGAQNSKRPEENLRTLASFINGFTVLSYGVKDAEMYGIVRTNLRRMGRPIGAVDTFIAAHALANDLTLVTNNLKHFQHVDGLKLENWLHSSP